MAAPTPKPSEPPPLRVQSMPPWPKAISAVRAVELSCTMTVFLGSTEASCASSTAGCTGDVVLVLAHQVLLALDQHRGEGAHLRALAGPRPAFSAPCTRPSAWVMAFKVSGSSHCAARSSG